MSLTRSIGYGGGASVQTGAATYVSSARGSSPTRMTRPISGTSTITRPLAFAAQSSPNSRFSTPGYRSGSPTYQRASPIAFAQNWATSVTEAAASVARPPATGDSLRVTSGTVSVPMGASIGASAGRPALSAVRPRPPRHSTPAAFQSMRAPRGSSIAWEATVPAVATARAATTLEPALTRPVIVATSSRGQSSPAGGGLVWQQNISREELIASGRLLTKGSAFVREGDELPALVPIVAAVPVIDHSRFLAPSVATLAPQEVLLTEQEQMALNEYMTPQEVSGTLYQSDVANGYSDIELQQDDLVGQSDMDTDFRHSRSVDSAPAAVEPEVETAQPLPNPTPFSSERTAFSSATISTPTVQYEANVQAATMAPDIEVEAPTPPVPVSQAAATVPDSQVIDEANGRRRGTAGFVPDGRGGWGPASGAEVQSVDEANGARRLTAEYVPDGTGRWGSPSKAAAEPVTVVPDAVAPPVTIEPKAPTRTSGSRLSRAGFNV